MVSDAVDGIVYNVLMAHLINDLQKQLEPGYELRFKSAGAGKGIFMLWKNGRPYKLHGEKRITVNDSLDGYNYRRKVTKMLEDAGAIKSIAKSKPKEREPVVRSMPKQNDLQLALERANRTLKDPKADPTARGHARDYIKLARLYVHVVKQARQLEERLPRELQA